MANSSQKLSSQRTAGPDCTEASVRGGLGGSAQSLGLFALFYLYLYYGVDLRLLYHGAGEITNFPVFFKGWEFFLPFTRCPGGMVEYISAFLSQLFYYRWVGALVVTLQAWMLCLCIGYVLKVVNARRFRWIRFVPVFGLLVIYTQYAYHFPTTMGLLCALVFACLYLRLRRKRAEADSEAEGVSGRQALQLVYIGLFLVLSIVCYYSAGGAYLLFAVVCGIHELLRARRWLGVVYLSLAAAVPYVMGVFVFGMSPDEAFTELLPVSWRVLRFEERRRMIEVVYILYLLVPVTMLLLGLWQVLGLRTGSQAKAGGRNWPRFKWIVESLVLLGGATGAVFLSYDGGRKSEFAVDYYAYHRRWDDVLRVARRDADSVSVVSAVNRALYHTGRLGYDMFSYRQHPDRLFPSAERYQSVFWQRFDMCIDMGLINIAEHDLVECLEVQGAHPSILQRLAFANMVKGYIGSARIYLGALSNTLFHADWANKYLDLLESDPNLSTDDRIQPLRSLCLEEDYGFFDFDIEDILSQLLEENRQNRMAFEYLMASYLLAGRLDRFAENFRRLDDFDYVEIPPVYEEALLLYVFRTQKPFDLRGHQFSAESRQRFAAFDQVAKRYRGDKMAAFEELRRDYHDSYLFYYLYTIMGTKK